METRSIAIEEATEDSITSYGTLIDIHGTSATAVTDDFSFWNDLSIVDEGSPLAFGIVQANPRPYMCTTFERHQETTETLVPLDGDIVLALGAPTSEPYPDPSTVRAFHIARGKGLTLHRGTWHYAPYATGTDRVRTLVVFKKGTPENDLLLQNMAEDKGLQFQLAR